MPQQRNLAHAAATASWGFFVVFVLPHTQVGITGYQAANNNWIEFNYRQAVGHLVLPGRGGPWDTEPRGGGHFPRTAWKFETNLAVDLRGGALHGWGHLFRILQYSQQENFLPKENT